MRKSGFVTQVDFQAHLDKDWKVVHYIWPNIRGITIRPGAGRGGVGAHAASHEVGGSDPLTFVDIAGFGDYIDQALLQASSPTHVTVKLTALSIGYVPYHVSDAAGLANSPIFIDTAKVFINETVNTKMVKGLTIQQDGEDGEILAFKSEGDVAHGITDEAETDTYGLHKKWDANTGGLKIMGLGESFYGVTLIGFVTSDTSTKSTAGRAPIEVYVGKKDGTGIGDIGPDANIFAVRCKKGGGSSTAWIVDEDGDTWQKGIVTAESFHLPTGTTPNLGWLYDVNLGSLEEGETIAYDQSIPGWVDAWGVEYDNPRLVWKMYTDFFSAGANSNAPWVGTTIEGGTVYSFDASTHHPGNIFIYTGTGGNSGYRFMTATNCILIAGEEHTEFVFRTYTGVPIARLGFQDSVTVAAPTDGIWINIVDDVLTGKTRNNGVESTTGTNYTLVNTTWYRAKIAVNSDATLITFILYSEAGVLLWTNTLAANIPTAAGRMVGHGIVAYTIDAPPEAVPFGLIFVDMMIATRAGAEFR